MLYFTKQNRITVTRAKAERYGTGIDNGRRIQNEGRVYVLYVKMFRYWMLQVYLWKYSLDVCISRYPSIYLSIYVYAHTHTHTHTPNLMYVCIYVWAGGA